MCKLSQRKWYLCGILWKTRGGQDGLQIICQKCSSFNFKKVKVFIFYKILIFYMIITSRKYSKGGNKFVQNFQIKQFAL